MSGGVMETEKATSRGLTESTNPPFAEGTLGKTPLLHLIIYMLDQVLTGTMTFQIPLGVTHAIYFHEGVPAKVRTGTIVSPLDRVLVDLGLLKEATLRGSLLEVSRKHVLHGALLVQKGLITEETLLFVLKTQLLRKVMFLFEQGAETRYAFYRDENLLAAYGGPELTPPNPLSLIMAGVRLDSTRALCESTLAKVGDRQLALHANAYLKGFDFEGEEQAVIDVIRGRRLTLAELIAAGAAQEPIVRRTVYALVVTRQLDFGANTKGPICGRALAAEGNRRTLPQGLPPQPSETRSDPPTRAAAPIVTRPPPQNLRSTSPIVGLSSEPPSVRQPAPLSPRASTSTSPRALSDAPQSDAPVSERRGHADAPSAADLAARRVEIGRRAETIDSENYFALLGVAEDATADQIRVTFFQMAKTWHPDRLPPELADQKPLVARVFSRLSEAYQTLVDPAKNKEYAKLLAQAKQGSDSAADQAHVARVVDAAMAFQKAEILLKKNDFAGAEQYAAAATEADPDQPEHQAVLAWIRAERRALSVEGDGAKNVKYDDLIKVLDKVIQASPQYERAVYYRGMLLKRSGLIDKAFRDFRRVAELNPKNIDAAREVRLHQMRLRTTPPVVPQSAGLLSKLWKK